MAGALATRRLLTRSFDGGEGTVLFVMLNPSTATEEVSDPTIRRCEGFAQRWGYARLEVVNLFSHRATRPKDLSRKHDARDDRVIREAVGRADRVVAAWGINGAGARARAVLAMLGACDCLGVTKDGHPRHPLYLRADTAPRRYRGAMTRDDVISVLGPVLDVVRTIDPSDPSARDKLEEALPLSALKELKALVRKAVAERVICDRETGPIRWSRVAKDLDGWSVDAVHMSTPGPGHSHPLGEVDLCFAADGDPAFDGNPEGWTVYPPGSWHVPTVTGGAMDILYFLPEGAIRFEARPE